EPRAPSSGELLGDNNGIHHNPRLRAEATRSISAVHALAFGAGAGEGAADTRAWSARLQTAVYANRYDDPIRLTARGTSPFLRHENAEGYRAVGVEWSAHAFTRRLDAAVSLTAQDAVILAGAYEGKRPAYVSEADAHAEAFLKPASGVRLGTMLDFRSPYYPGDANVPVSRRGVGVGRACRIRLRPRSDRPRRAQPSGPPLSRLRVQPAQRARLGAHAFGRAVTRARPPSSQHV